MEYYVFYQGGNEFVLEQFHFVIALTSGSVHSVTRTRGGGDIYFHRDFRMERLKGEQALVRKSEIWRWLLIGQWQIFMSLFLIIT